MSVSSVSNRLLNREMSIEKGITCSCTPGINAEVYSFRLSVCPFVCSLLSIALVEFTSKFSVKAHWTQVSDHCPLGYLLISRILFYSVNTINGLHNKNSISQINFIINRKNIGKFSVGKHKCIKQWFDINEFVSSVKYHLNTEKGKYTRIKLYLVISEKL